MTTQRRPDPDPEAATILQRGSPSELRALLDDGFDLSTFRHNLEYDALMTSVFGRDVFDDANLIETLGILIDAGAPLSGKSSYGESALSVLSHLGRFDGVEILLKAGADASLLQWTPLARAVALGTVEEVRDALFGSDQLEVEDRWSRTPFLIALARGSSEIAEILADAGADQHAKDHVGRTALFHAVAARKLEPVCWLLARGFAVDATDESGSSPLSEAVEADDWAMVDLLLRSGANPNHPQVGFSALASARSRSVATRLLASGADPRELTNDVQRLFTQPEVVDEATAFAGLSSADVEQDRTRRFGASNPDLMRVPFWNAMVRLGTSGYLAAKHFRLEGLDPERPVWCAQRFGRSLTPLPDGRFVQIGGEHEDGYDPDFCIYNDVIVHHPDGQFEVFGYPKRDFSPTDFHSATLVGDCIVVIGSVGYQGERLYGITPVYKLDIATWRMTRLVTSGEAPGWISRHLATMESEREIVVSGGKIMHEVEGVERYDQNSDTFVLHLDSGKWRHRQ